MGTTGIDGSRTLTTASSRWTYGVKEVQKTTVTDKADRLADSSVAKALRGLFAADEATYAYALAA